MTVIRIACVATLLALGSAVAGVQLAGAGYAVDGDITGSASVEPDSNSGWMDTEQYGYDTFEWNEDEGHYDITDGDTGTIVGYMVVEEHEPSPPDYDVSYYDPLGQPEGSGTWTKAQL